MTTVIPYGKQSISEGDVREVIRALRSPWISQGPKIQAFEEALAAYAGTRYAVAVSSGTAGLHLACLAAGLAPGAEAITTPMTFLATPNAVLYTGATPVFADIQYDSVNIDPEDIARRITRKTKAILPVHFAGLPADLAEIERLGRKKGLLIIEDACHALGASYRGGKIGSCAYSDMTVFSFHPVKHITTGEGGCITTNSRQLYASLRALRNHGVARSPSISRRHGPWATEMHTLGYNYRITDIQCALGFSQLKKVDRFVRRREAIASFYDKGFRPYLNRFKLPGPLPGDRKHGWHLYLLRVLGDPSGRDRLRLYRHLHRRGILAQVHYRVIYHHPYYRKDPRYRNLHLPQAERYYRETLSLPLFPDLRETDTKRVVSEITQWARGAA